VTPCSLPHHADVSEEPAVFRMVSFFQVLCLRFGTNFSYAVRATCSAHLVHFDLILVMPGHDYKL